MKKQWTQTKSGIKFYPFEPSPEMINIEDIAHGLSNMCRFHGQTKFFYSVAQHCNLGLKIINKQDACNIELKLLWLLHDASEAYILDMPTPIKIGLSDYKKLEENLVKVIFKKFNLKKYTYLDHTYRLMKHVDEQMLANEYDALFDKKLFSAFLLKPLPWMKIRWQPRFYTKWKFLRNFKSIMSELDAKV